jgi:hypothetical protein
MPDIACVYTLTTPNGTIIFNDGAIDQFYIQGITGLGTPPIRAPIDDVPYGDGSIGHNFWKGGRHIAIEGVFLITSEDCGVNLVGAWNLMEDDLRIALESIAALTTATGTLVWTPTGTTPARTLIVRHDVPLECPPDQNFTIRNFSFGLFAADPTWTTT